MSSGWDSPLLLVGDLDHYFTGGETSSVSKKGNNEQDVGPKAGELHHFLAKKRR